MRLLFDLFPCQTDSRFRGIGRYTLSLAQEMARQAPGRGAQTRLMANGLYPESMAALRHAFAGITEPGALSSYSHPPLVPGNDPVQEEIASALIEAAYHATRPDVVFCASPFEGWCERGMAARPDAGPVPALKVALLYDFIPLRFAEQHLDHDAGYAAWYRRRLDGLQRYDLFLAISEATRADAITYLGVAPERVVNISGASDARFTVMEDRDTGAAICRQLGIVRPFVLYTGNGDYRKNLGGMLRAYALLPETLRAGHQLVVNQVGDPVQFERLLQNAGLRTGEVVVTGHITDIELNALYNHCTVFVFPSLFEGFGLPVLEAMACGAPVLAANNSSIPEVAGRDDLLFDAADPHSIETKLARVLTDADWRADLARHSLERARSFSWQRTAKLAWDAIANARASLDVQCALRIEQTQTAFVARAALHDVPAPQPQTALLAAPGSVTRQSEAHLSVALVGTRGAIKSQAATFALLGATAQLTAFSLPALDDLTTLSARLQRFDAVLYISDGMDAGVLTALARNAPGVLWLRSLPERTGPDDAALLHHAGLQGFFATSGDTLPGLDRALREALYCIVAQDAALAATLAAPAGLPQPPARLSCARGPAAHEQAAALLPALEAAAAMGTRRTVARISAAWQEKAPGITSIEGIAMHAERNQLNNRTARLLIDVTQLVKTDAQSGIQRVVRNIARELCMDGAALPPIELVHLVDGRLWRAHTIAASVLGRVSVPPAPIDIQPGDLFFMIDSSWEQYPQFVPLFDAVRLAGGRVVTVIYDLIPLRMPQFCSTGLVLVFQRWFALAVRHSDMLLCISRAVRDDVAAYIDEHRLTPSHPLRLAHWQLGADIAPAGRDQVIRPAVARMAADHATPLFMMVGTIEPRKGHAGVLDAFDALWAQGSQVRLCLAGKEGWEVDVLMQRIRTHRMLGTRLFFVEHFSDAEINLCYANAHALIAGSVAEGYGLPIVEAAQHKVPVIATDIAVFREVAGNGAAYFPLGDRAALMSLVTQFAGLDRPAREAMAARVSVLSWQDSARQAWQRLRSTWDVAP
jgi:glycosyltransferase involved in cell wall biosynthesis